MKLSRSAHLFLVFVLAASACGDDTAATTGSTASAASSSATTAPTATTAASGVAAVPEAVLFQTSDGLTLEGTLFGGGGDTVVLGAMGFEVMETWFPFADTLASAGYTALAYNMRGHGASEGDPTPFRVDVDAQAAIDYMRSQGSERIFFIGASVNGAGAIAAGAANDLAGIVDLAGPDVVDGVDAVALAPEVAEPKLFVVADGDGPIPAMIQSVADAAPEPKEVVVLSGTEHGTDLFSTHGDELTALLLDFLRSN